MKHLQDILETSHKMILAGIGNVLKHDDAVGVYISNNIVPTSVIHPLTVELSIENYIGKINQVNSDTLILADCVHFNREPGYSRLIPLKQLIDHTTHTHNIALNKLNQFFQMEVYVLGIQPKDVSFGEGMTPAVKTCADQLISLINTYSYARAISGH
jgi:hydrogenase 3 maturation protease